MLTAALYICDVKVRDNVNTLNDLLLWGIIWAGLIWGRMAGDVIFTWFK